MTVSSFCLDLLRSRGPLTLDELTELASGAGATRARNPVASVRSAIAHRAVQLSDSRWASPLRLLEGRILTTPAHGRDWPDDGALLPSSHYDLELLRLAAREAALPFQDGGCFKSTPYGALSPPDFSRLDLGPHELLGLRVRDGVVHTEPTALTPGMRQAGRLLADALGPLDKGRTPYWSTGLASVSDNLCAALWDRMATDPDFLTSPVPPLSQCIPALAHTLHVEREHQREREQRWQARLDLPIHLRWAVQHGSELAGVSVDEWLNAFVERSLRELGESYDAEPADELYAGAWPELPFPRRLRSI